MATDVLLIREKSGLVAADPISAESVEALALGEMVTATIRRSRNPRFHRMFFALLKLVFDNQDRYATMEQLLDAVKIEVGLYDLMTLPGKIPVQVCKPRSISFARMDQTEFKQFFDKVVAFVLSEVLPGTEKDDLERQVLEIVGA